MASKPEVEEISHGEADQNDNSKGHVTHSNSLCNPATSSPKTFRHASLPQFETSMCFAVAIGTVLYIQYRTSVLSKGEMLKIFIQNRLLLEKINEFVIL